MNDITREPHGWVKHTRQGQIKLIECPGCHQPITGGPVARVAVSRIGYLDYHHHCRPAHDQE